MSKVVINLGQGRVWFEHYLEHFVIDLCKFEKGSVEWRMWVTLHFAQYLGLHGLDMTVDTLMRLLSEALTEVECG